MSQNGSPIVELRGISKRFSGVEAVRSIDLVLQPGEVHALVGKNGAGKSTLIKILSGAIIPDDGEILLRGRRVAFRNPRDALEEGIATINQELMLVPQLGAAENILLGRLPHKQLGRVDWVRTIDLSEEALSTLGVELNLRAPVSSLSVAQQQAVEIARALSRQAEIIIMDEPTAALASREVNNLLAYVERLRSQGKTVIYVTHRLEEVFRIADLVTVMRDGSRVATLLAKETTPEEVVSLMVGGSLNGLYSRGRAKMGASILEVKGLTREDAFYDISFSLHRGEILGIAGLMGAGRTELVRAIFGIDPIDSGEIWVDGRQVMRPSPAEMIAAGVGLAPEDRKHQGLVLGMSVGDNLVLAALRSIGKWGLRNRAVETEIATHLFTDLSIVAPSLGTILSSLSGGNQQKVVIGKWLATKPRILILDEPTRGIDVSSKAEIHAFMQHLAGEGVAIIHISSDLQEVISTSDRTIVMYGGRIVRSFSSAEVSEGSVMASASGQEGTLT